MDNIPEVSIITPVYNAGKYLAECIESVLSQTFSGFEYIVVDDGSTDNSLKIINDFAEKDKRVRLIQNRKNMGQAFSMNAGCVDSKGEFIAVMDADDVAKPERIEKQYLFLRDNTGYGACGTLQELIDEKSRPFIMKEPPQKTGDITDVIYEPVNLSHPTFMFRRAIVEEVGGYRPEFERAQDYDFFLRIIEKYRIYNLPEVLLEHRFSIDRATIKDRKTQIKYTELARRLYFQRKAKGRDLLQEGRGGDFLMLKKEVFGPVLVPGFMELSSNYFYWARRMYHRGPIDCARKLAKMAVALNPLNLVAFIYLVFLYLGPGIRDSVSRTKNFSVKNGK